MTGYCKTHTEHMDGCLDCAIDYAVEQSPDGNSLVGLARLIPAELWPAYFEQIVSGVYRELQH